MTASCFLIKPQRAADLDTAEVRRALSIFADPAAGCFVQGLPWAHWETPRGDDLDGLVAAVGRVAGLKGTYFGLNPCPPGEKATDKAVLSRRWMLFDWDSMPAHGESRNATAAERDEVHSVALGAAEYLFSRGWSPPVMVDSGNGTHLLYRVDLPNDRLAKETIRTVLTHVAKRCGTDTVKLGVECCDARRISKLPGTLACKGEPTKAHPQRLARLVYVPDVVEVIDAELLTALANEERKAGPATPPPSTNGTTTRGPVWVLRPSDDLTAYAEAALKTEVALVQMASRTGRNAQLYKGCCAIGELLWWNVWVRQQVESDFFIACVLNGLVDDPEDGPDKCRDCIRRGLDQGAKQPRAKPTKKAAEPSGHTGDGKWTFSLCGETIAEGTPAHFAELGSRIGGVAKEQTFEILSLDELMRREFPPPDWVVPGLLAEGLNILAGAPKLGKSILALNLALTVAGGGKALGNIQSQPGHVLYLSLEDRLRRVQSRAAKMLTKIQGTGAGDRLSVLNRWPRMDHGGLALLSEWVKRVGRPALIIIDVLGKFKPPSRDRGNQYEQDCQALYPVKEFADENKCTALVIHHTRKTRGKDDTEDFVETVNGTLGTTGACDGILVLQRSRNSKEARISLTSRDDAEQKLALEFDDESLTWKSMGSAEEYLTGKLQMRVMGYLKSLAGSFTFVSDIADHLGEPPDKLRPVLHRLFERGLLRHKGQTWGYPGPNVEGVTEANTEAF
jgi:hypothetical protein